MKILVTEDDKMTQMILEKTLIQDGHKVILSSSAKDALDILKTNRFDVILVDIHMPELDGISLIGKIRNDLTLRTPIAIVTRDKDENTLNMAFESGADDYILKPFDKNDLLKRINRLADKNI